MEEKFPFEKIEREILVKVEETSNKRYGKAPEERTVEESLNYGIININKSPALINSYNCFRIMEMFKKFKTKKNFSTFG